VPEYCENSAQTREPRLADVEQDLEQVSFTTPDGGLIHSDQYGTAERGVVLAHGGRSNMESWKKQEEALEKAGFRVLAINFRGYGQSIGPGDSDPLSAPLQNDVLGAVRYLRKMGAKTVAVVGGSMGGSAAGDASVEAEPCATVLLPFEIVAHDRTRRHVPSHGLESGTREG
jgi:pimeloyl-ACP methyl ester carboxylesterase